jgi:hypothetical protein
LKAGFTTKYGNRQRVENLRLFVIVLACQDRLVAEMAGADAQGAGADGIAAIQAGQGNALRK